MRQAFERVFAHSRIWARMESRSGTSAAGIERQNRAVAVILRDRSADVALPPSSVGLEFDAVPEIVIAAAGAVGNLDLITRDVVLVAVHDGPKRLSFEWKSCWHRRRSAGRGRVRFPIRAHEQSGKLAFDLRDAAQGFGVARRDLIPDAPDVFPAFVADAVEEGELQIVGLVASPAVADIDHVAGLEPFQLADQGDKADTSSSPSSGCSRSGLHRLRARPRVRRRAGGRLHRTPCGRRAAGR